MSLLVEVTCHGCGHPSVVGSSFVGREGKCPSCLYWVLVDDPGPQPSGLAPEPGVPEEGALREEAGPPPIDHAAQRVIGGEAALPPLAAHQAPPLAPPTPPSWPELNTPAPPPTESAASPLPAESPWEGAFRPLGEPQALEAPRAGGAPVGDPLSHPGLYHRTAATDSDGGHQVGLGPPSAGVAPHPTGPHLGGQAKADPPHRSPSRWVRLSRDEIAATLSAPITGKTKPCVECGEEIRSLARRCDFCGQYQSERERAAVRRANPVGLPLATPAKRMAAALINGVAFVPIPSVMAAPFVFLAGGNLQSGKEIGLAALISVSLLLLYFGVQWAWITRTGASLGKRVMKIRAVKVDGSEVGFLDGVVLREWTSWGVLCLCSYLGFIFWAIEAAMLFRQDGRTIHDFVAGTVVVDSERYPHSSGARPFGLKP